MKRKTEFLRAIQILAPGDDFVFRAAQRVPEETLPDYPGGAALEMVVALQKLGSRAAYHSRAQRGDTPEGQLSMSHALRIQSAHFWLKLGEIDQALLELGKLSTNAFSHPSAVKARVAIQQASRNRTEVTVQE